MTETKQTLCPHCLTANRVPLSRLRDRPNCGKCKEPLFTAIPIDVSETTFKKFLSHEQLPLIVDFWASWCGPCKAMAPHFAAAAKALSPQYRLLKVNTEEAQALSSQFGIRSIPTVIAFQHGREVNRVAGALTQPQLLQWVESLGLR